MGAARYEPYPAYKPSGVEWSHEFPDEWEATRFKNLFTIKKRIAGKIGPDVLSITQKGIKVKDLESGEGQLASDYSKYQHVYAGDFAMNHMDLLTGYVDISKYDGVTSPDYRVFSLDRDDCHPAFYLYILQHCYHAKIFFPLGQGAAHLGRWRLPAEAFNTFVAPVPSLPEQTKIAAFLDFETGKIDALIAKQERLIALLEEKRQAVISHAVTKGLNPTAPLRPSGIDWLGDVPEHWGVAPLKYLCSFSGGGTPSKEVASFWRDGTVPWVSPKDMKTFYLDETQDKITPAAVENSSTNYVEPGALLMVVRSGILQRAIPIAINRNQVTLNQDMKAIRFGSKVLVEYAANYILGYQKELLLEWSKEGATVESIEQEYLSQHLFFVPPEAEQREICEFLQNKKKYFDALNDQAQSAITLLKERRTALISAAVTGKIDVRDWLPPRPLSDTDLSTETLQEAAV